MSLPCSDRDPQASRRTAARLCTSDRDGTTTTTASPAPRDRSARERLRSPRRAAVRSSVGEEARSARPRGTRPASTPPSLAQRAAGRDVVERVADLTPREAAERQPRHGRLREHPDRGGEERVGDAPAAQPPEDHAGRRPVRRGTRRRAARSRSRRSTTIHDRTTRSRRRPRRTRSPRHGTRGACHANEQAGRTRRTRAARHRAAGGRARAARRVTARRAERAPPRSGPRAVAADHALLVGELVPRQHEEAARQRNSFSAARDDLGAALARLVGLVVVVSSSSRPAATVRSRSTTSSASSTSSGWSSSSRSTTSSSVLVGGFLDLASTIGRPSRADVRIRRPRSSSTISSSRSSSSQLVVEVLCESRPRRGLPRRARVRPRTRRHSSCSVPSSGEGTCGSCNHRDRRNASRPAFARRRAARLRGRGV